jgi:protein gp37
MGQNSSIEWLLGGHTWNMIRARNSQTGKVGWGCVKVGKKCARCYAENQNIKCGTNPGRMGNGLPYAADKLPIVEFFLHEKTLQQPLHWGKPAHIFPCSMTDLFGSWVSDEWLDKIYDVMETCTQHTFLILTKRPERRREYLARRYQRNEPAQNIWEGCSPETQQNVIDLIETPAALRWLSEEPILGPIDYVSQLPKIDWLVVGGESGPEARPTNIRWVANVIGQCKGLGVPVFVKQLGSDPYYGASGESESLALTHPKGGEIDEWPEELRVREYPKTGVLA